MKDGVQSRSSSRAGCVFCFILLISLYSAITLGRYLDLSNPASRAHPRIDALDHFIGGFNETKGKKQREESVGRPPAEEQNERSKARLEEAPVIAKNQDEKVKTTSLKVPLPVITVGFPKSGTTSLHNFFTCSGVSSQHFCCCGDESDHPPCSKKTMAVCVLENMAQGRKMLEGCGDYEAYCQIDGERPVQRKRSPPDFNRNGVLLEDGSLEFHDLSTPAGRQEMYRHFLPQHFQLQRLHEDYEAATYVLPLRNSTEWAISALNWFQMRGRFVNEYMAHNSSLQRPGKAGAMQFLVRIYNEHTEYIRQFVKAHPQHKLIEFHISDPSAGEKLADAFGLQYNAACWGHHNKIGTRAKTPERLGVV